MRRRLGRWLVLLVLGLVGLVVWKHRFGEPEDFAHMEMQYKYGSIGADHPLAQAPLPYWLWKVLPEVIPPDTVLSGSFKPYNGQKGFATFGLVSEARPVPVPGQPWLTDEYPWLRLERPIGVSLRRVFGIDFVGLNCAFCHLGTLQAKPGAPREVVLGGVGQSIDIEQYFEYLFAAMTSPQFTADRVMPAIDRELARQRAELGWFQRALYRWVVIPVLPGYLRQMEHSKFDFILKGDRNALPDFGPGRVDTWSLYKRTFVDPPQRTPIPGTVDFPALWNQKARVGFRMHWDGNTDVLIERNVISALSIVGRRVQYLDFERLVRVTDWIEGLLPPRYEDRAPAGLRGAGADGRPLPPIDAALALQGSATFDRHCARCHAPQGDRIGRVEPIEDLGTDPNRFQEFTPELMTTLNTLGTDQWQLRHFRLQRGYVNTLLDGLWLRGPYLHNGSVPTLRHLLLPPDRRPRVFCRGSDMVDWINVGYEHATTRVGGQETCPGAFRFDTSVPGNGAGGHLYGTDLPESDRAALLEFLKTL